MAATDHILAGQAISAHQVRLARIMAAQAKRSVVEVLEEQLALGKIKFVDALGHMFHFPVYGVEELNKLVPAFDVLSFAEAQERECVALRDGDGRLFVIMGDPFNAGLQTWAELRIVEDFDWGLAHNADVAAYLAHHEESLSAMQSLQVVAGKRATPDENVEELSLRTISGDISPVVKLVHSTLYDALKCEASDIHFETGASGLEIKYRIDGVLTVAGSVAGQDMAEQVISRIKVISGLDIAERRIPQDGRFKVSIQQHEVDLRVSIMPSILGEDAVLRILDKQTLSDQIKGLRLDYLGFDAASIATLRRLSSEPYGMVLVTGPTGSGKTTTLYAAISEINNGQDKIITIEDPVEYQLHGVLQIPVNEKKGLTFERGLRSILRHDPDKIMVGEIRDPETAQIAVQSALTGHLVFTTVHANNVFDVIGRFMHMGIDPYSFVSALNGILAQRLIRVNCTQCAADVHPGEALLRESGIDAAAAATAKFRAGRGCTACRGTGYKGRKAIAEILNMNDEIRELIIARKPLRLVREAARRGGTRFLREGALAMAFRGETTLQEINRVTFVA
ncbi:MAG: GspE/PulE family protein [Sideroxyarcus sp.]|nr:GspE/PulE family protein [Sideroxyarcus sp.]